MKIYAQSTFTSAGIGRFTLSSGGLKLYISIAAFALLAISSAMAFAEKDLPSTPQQPAFKPSPAPALRAAPKPSVPVAAAQTSTLATFGLEFEASRYQVNSGFIQPDTMGAVGPNHIVEMINGRFAVFNKVTGTAVEDRSLDSFWANRAGVTIPVFNDICNIPAGTCSQSGNACTSNAQCVSNFTFDPRIVYDPSSQRWFAVSLDATNPATGENNLDVARSMTSDLTGAWNGLRFDTDTVGNAEFHDYETLAVDANGLYTCTQDFNDGGHESCYSIPKADLLVAVPSIANMTRFEATPAGLPTVSGSVQPALDFAASSTRTPLLGVNGGILRRSDILGGAAAGATLGAIRGIVGDPGHATPPAARQPHPNDATVTIENVAPRFVGNVVKRGNSLWAVHAVAGSASNSALRWYEINEATDTVLQTGLINDPNRDFHEPSITVNELGNVVIGYTCSGPNLSPSTCVSLGETIAGVTTFEAPVIIQAGAGHYYQQFNNRNCWGDYSATVVDPKDSCTFWTFQEFVALSAVGNVGPANPPARPALAQGGRWGTQVTELTFNSCAKADLSITKTDAPDPVAASGQLTYTLAVLNQGPSRAREVKVVDTLPSGVQFISATGANWSCVFAAGIVTCNWQGGNPTGSLAAEQSASQITILVKVSDGLVDDNGSTIITNKATVSSTTPDPNPANNTATADTKVLPGCGGQFATIIGTPGIDNIIGTAGADVIAGLAGKDNIIGLGGNDKICGGKGDDNIRGEEGNDFIDGGPAMMRSVVAPVTIKSMAG